VRIDLPRWLLADRAGCLVWLGLAAAVEIVAAPALGMPPGPAFLLVAAAGALATMAAIGCRHRPMALATDGRTIEAVAAAGRPGVEYTAEGSRVMGGSVVVRLKPASPSRWRYSLWITPCDASAGSLRRIALALRLGSREA
jgi:hypothetical protein